MINVTGARELNAKPERIIYIDWLRIFTIFMVFVFHCARFFDRWGWHVKNNDLSLGVTVLSSFLILWIMPTFFMISGFSSYYSLRYRNSSSYIIARLKRLIIPLTFGIFFLIPPQVYIERLTQSQFQGSLLDFLPLYFHGFYGSGGNFAWMGLHLWYLLFLFIFSLLTLPVFLYFKRRTDITSAMGTLFSKPEAIFLLVIPPTITELLVNLNPSGIGRRDFGGWSLLVYIFFFIYGYLMASDSGFRIAIERNKTPALIIALPSTILLITGLFLTSYFAFLGETLIFILGSFLRVLSSWCWLIVIMGFGGKHLNFSNSFLKYTNEAVLPFYILHQTVIVIIGYYMVDWQRGILLKYLTLFMSSFAIIILIYELLIRRIKLFRFLFGMKTN
jgi:peptidoglycan/LPS O-acetylase OafA/YrhL